MVDLSICVLHYNRWDLTKDCLSSIDMQEIPCSYEKVLVDNGSTEPLPSLPQGWRVVKYQENHGHIVGQNRCFESAQGEWVLFVANDVRPKLYCIKALWKNRDDGWARITFPWLLTPELKTDNLGLTWRWPGYGISHCRPPLRHSFSFTGSCYLMQKSVWKDVGRFDERLETSHEEIDFCLRAQRLEHRCREVASAKALHLGNATLRFQPSHTRAAFHRDRVYVIQKHYRGLSRLLRLAAVNLLDSFPRW